MDTQSLVGKATELVAGLDKRQIRVTSAVWAHSSEDGQWRLILATPALADRGPVAVYSAIQDVLKTVDVGIPLSSIGVVNPKDSFAQFAQENIPPHAEYTDVTLVPSTSASSATSSVATLLMDRMVVYNPSGKRRKGR